MKISSPLYFPALLTHCDADMRRITFILFLAAVLALLAGWPGARAADTNALPDFEVIYGLIRSNLAGVTETELNRAATQGLLDQFRGQLSLVTEDTATDRSAEVPRLAKPAIYEGAFACLRVTRVADGLAADLSSGLESLAGTAKLKGLVIDLRFADGADYAAAAKVADLFLAEEKPLLNWGDTEARSTAKPTALTMPVMVLVNHQTRGAAEALAAVIRQAGIGLVIGTATGGEANLYTEFSLPEGRRLRIATAKVRLGNGEPLPAHGVTPDIQVNVNADDEKAWFTDAYKVLPGALTQTEPPGATNQSNGASTTNRPSRRRINEAELVRLQREGLSFDEEAPAGSAKTDPAKPLVRDPALARSLDLLKGLAIVQQSRPL